MYYIHGSFLCPLRVQKQTLILFRGNKWNFKISATTRVVDYVTSKSSKVIIRQNSVKNRKKSMTASDNKTQAGGLSGFLKTLSIKGVNASKMMSKDDWKNLGRALDITPNFASAVVCRKPKATLS